MPIKAAERTCTYDVYFAECSQCGAEGPDAGTPQAAHMLAIDEGWTVELTHQGNQPMQVHTCAECNAENIPPRYWRNEDTGRVMESESWPGRLWYEIDAEEYDAAKHPKYK